MYDYLFRSKKLAPDGGANGGGGATPPEGGEDGANGGDGGSQTMTFDEMLASNPEFQKEFDRRQTKGINTAVTKERDRLTALHNSELSEAQRLARMNEDEKREYLDQKREKELADREAAITRRELAAEAKNTLADKGLPVSFADLLDYKDAESVKRGIEALAQEWQPAVEHSVNERLKDGKPPKDAGTEGKTSEQEMIDKVRGYMSR